MTHPCYIIGNWKSNKTRAETKEWFDQFKVLTSGFKIPESVNVIICVPYTLLSVSQEMIVKYVLPIKIGAQDVSPFRNGAYTGEVTAKMIKEFADFVLIGHSERRTYFNETDEELAFESLQAHDAGLRVIYCVSNDRQNISQVSDYVAYEPVEAIGSGVAENPERAEVMCQTLKQKTKKPILYGGSVTAENVNSYLKKSSIDGVLVGSQSLVPDTFIEIIQAASSIQ